MSSSCPEAKLSIEIAAIDALLLREGKEKAKCFLSFGEWKCYKKQSFKSISIKAQSFGMATGEAMPFCNFPIEIWMHLQF